MKTSTLLGTAIVTSLIVIAACQKSKETLSQDAAGIQQTDARPPRQMGACEPNAYLVTLLNSNVQVNNTYEWTWSVQNPNPGNGMNGTVQNMSHWGFPINSCVDPSTIVGAAYSGDGVNWTNFTHTIQVDPSQACLTSPVLKFNFGTNGGNPSYYRLYTSVPYEVDGGASAYYKSGSNTGCCVFEFDGMYCGGDDGEIR